MGRGAKKGGTIIPVYNFIAHVAYGSKADAIRSLLLPNCEGSHSVRLLHSQEKEIRKLLFSSFVCSLNPICQTFIPQPLFHYSIILSPLFFTNVSAPFCFELRTHLPVEWGQSKTKTFTLLRRSQSGTRIIGPIHHVCEFRMKRKELIVL